MTLPPDMFQCPSNSWLVAATGPKSEWSGRNCYERRTGIDQTSSMMRWRGWGAGLSSRRLNQISELAIHYQNSAPSQRHALVFKRQRTPNILGYYIRIWMLLTLDWIRMTRTEYVHGRVRMYVEVKNITINRGEALTDRKRSGSQARRQNILIYLNTIL